MSFREVSVWYGQISFKQMPTCQQKVIDSNKKMPTCQQEVIDSNAHAVLEHPVSN